MISPVDPCSAWTAKANKRVQFGYGLNYLIDIEHAIIVDVEANPARTYDEVAATKTMIERTEESSGSSRSGLWPIPPMGPAGSSVGWSATESRRISPSGITAVERMAHCRAATFVGTENAAFIFVPPTRYSRPPAKRARSQSALSCIQGDCRACPLKPQCSPKTPSRKIPRDVHEDARDMHADSWVQRGSNSRATNAKGRDAICPSEDSPSF